MARWKDDGGLGLDADLARGRSVAAKLGQGHAADELSESQLGGATGLGIALFASLTQDQRLAFESVSPSSVVIPTLL